MKLKLHILGAAFCFGLGTVSVNASTIVSDGGFTDALGFGFKTVNSSFGPWTVTSGSVDVIGNYWQAPVPGQGSVDLDGNSPGAISQTLSNLAAGTYLLTFAISGNPDGSPQTKGVEVKVGEVSKDFFYTITGSKNNMSYTTETLVFTWGGGDTSLSFTSLDNSTPYGAAVGNVSISAVPEPTTWAMMIFGFLGVGLMAYLRNNKPNFRLA